MMTTAAKISAMALDERRKSQRGLAMLEAIPLLVVFVMLVGYAMGLFGAIHSAILQSIAARNYAFETFRNRTNLNMFRENSGGEILSYAKSGVRFHAIGTEVPPANDPQFYATRRPVSIGWPTTPTEAKRADHMIKIFDIGARNQNVGVDPMWIMVSYGICLNAGCGDR